MTTPTGTDSGHVHVNFEYSETFESIPPIEHREDGRCSGKLDGPSFDSEHCSRFHNGSTAGPKMVDERGWQEYTVWKSNSEPEYD